jgi:hypothetical protein
VLQLSNTSVKLGSVSYYIFLSFLGWGETESTSYVGNYLAYCISPGWQMSIERLVNENWQGKLKYSEESSLSVTLSTTNPTWLSLGWKPGPRGSRVRTENTASNSSSIVVWVSVVAITGWSLPSLGVFTELFPSNGCLCWLHSSRFQQTCHNT